MIDIRNLSKRYGSFLAVNDISLHVGAGEIFGFLGVNGAGKTTTLKMLTGVLRPTSGSISVGGFDLAKQPLEAKKLIGYVPDRPYLYNRLSALEYLQFCGSLHDLSDDLILARSEELLRQDSLSQWKDELIEGFSHGMKQRLAVCAALIHEPRVLVVDEPMVGLDPHGARVLKQYFRDYAKKGISVLLSTHSLNVAEELADRLAIINKGSIIAIGTLQEIRGLVGAHDKGLEEIFLELTWESSGQEESL